MTIPYKQRLADAETILRARWPAGQLSLTYELKQAILGVMLEYSLQCEVVLLNEIDGLHHMLLMRVGEVNNERKDKDHARDPIHTIPPA